MKVLRIAKYPPIQGGESSKSYWTTRSLGAAGHEITVLSNGWHTSAQYLERIKPESIDQYMPANVRVSHVSPFDTPRFVPFYEPVDRKMVSLGISLLESHKYDLIDASYLLPYGCVAAELATLVKLPFVVSHAGSDITRLLHSYHYAKYLSSVLLKANAVMTFRGGTRLIEAFGVAHDKIYEIPPWLDTDAFSPVKRNRLRQTTSVTNPVVTLGFFGKLSRGKGILELFEALSPLRDCSWRLIVCGGGPVEFQAKRLAHQLGISDKVQFTSFVAPWDVPEMLARCDVFLSVETGFGVEVHGPSMPREALSMGIPVVLSEEIACYAGRNDEHGFIRVNPKNRDGYTRVLSRCISDREYLEATGRAGRDWILSDLQSKNGLNEREMVWEAAVNNKKGSI